MPSLKNGGRAFAALLFCAAFPPTLAHASISSRPDASFENRLLPQLPSALAALEQREAQPACVAFCGTVELSFKGDGFFGGGGSVVSQDAWGNHRFPAELDASKNRFGFTGYELDKETGLYNAKARYFDPQFGRFLTQDSYLGQIDNPPSLHRYFYGHANPTRYIDATGHEVLPASCYSGGAVCGSRPPAGFTQAEIAFAGAVTGAADLLVVAPAKTFYNVVGGVAYRITGHEAFRAQAEAHTTTAESVRENFKTPQHLATSIGEGVLESKRRYDERFEAGDVFGASREWGSFGTQAFLTLEGASSVRVTPTPALATAEGRILQASGTVGVSRSGVPAGVLLAKNVKGSEGTVQDAARESQGDVPAGELAPGVPPLQPGRTPLREFDIDLYKRFGGTRTGDELAGHEMLQNAWLKAHGHAGRRGVGTFSRDNPAMALRQEMHTRIGAEQVKLGLNDPSRLKAMGSVENIELNAQAMRNAGLPEHVVQTLQKEAMKHAATLPR